MNKKDKTERLLETSLKIFARFGYKKTTVEDIATELGMTKGNLYLYVRDKRDLYEKTVAHGLRRWQRNVITSIENIPDIVDQLITICRKSYEYLSLDEDMRNVVINDPAIFPLYPEEDHFYRINIESMNILKGLLQKGIDAGRFRPVDVDHLTDFIYSVYIMFVHKTYVKMEGKTVEAMFDAALDVILKGLLESANVLNQKYLVQPISASYIS
ncbi:MAG: hypothetical protein CVV44_20105 [Spirochaetae bacterium HGW-Spirochaetae-1]|jgi:AcrR family transcriptional regulator|nr:MAG: hypothetical protein CVV44_20105 [Spirochaetae bacterium HGW-Spirochaetae-1]